MQTTARRTSLFAVVFAIVSMLSVGIGHERGRVQDSSNAESAESQRSITRSSIELARNQRTQKRNSQLLAEIRSRMRQLVEIQVNDMLMAEFPEYLREAFDCPVSLDNAELELAGFDPEVFSVTGSYSGVRGDTALRDLLYQSGCGYYIQGG